MMKMIPAVVGRMVADVSAQDLVEYGLLVGLIAIVVMAGTRYLGQTINSVLWEFIAATLG